MLRVMVARAYASNSGDGCDLPDLGRAPDEVCGDYSDGKRKRSDEPRLSAAAIDRGARRFGGTRSIRGRRR